MTPPKDFEAALDDILLGNDDETKNWKAKILEAHNKSVAEARVDLSNIQDWVKVGLDPTNTNKDVPYKCLQMINNELKRLEQLKGAIINDDL